MKFSGFPNLETLGSKLCFSYQSSRTIIKSGALNVQTSSASTQWKVMQLIDCYFIRCSVTLFGINARALGYKNYMRARMADHVT